jgi:acyl carrier protein
MLTLKELLAKVLDIEKESINDNSSPENIPSWDSFNALMIVSELEDNFNVKFTINEVVAVKKFTDIKDALKRHGVTEGVDD